MYVFEVNEIESLATLRSLQIALGMGFCNFIMEGDSWNVVETIKTRNASFLSRGPLILEINRLLHLFPDFEILHMRQQDNEAAHMLALHARNIKDTLQW